MEAEDEYVGGCRVRKWLRGVSGRGDAAASDIGGPVLYLCQCIAARRTPYCRLGTLASGSNSKGKVR